MSTGSAVTSAPTSEPATAPAPVDGEAAFSARLARAAALYDERRLPEAERELIEALRLRPSDLRAHRLIARVQLRLGRFADAQASFASIVKLSPRDGQARFELGLLALRNGQASVAVTELGEASRLQPGDSRIKEYLAAAWARLGRLTDEAAGTAEVVVKSATPLGPELALADLAAARLLPAESTQGAHVGSGVFRLPVEADSAIHVAPGALVAVIGAVTASPAARRRPGRMAEAANDDTPAPELPPELQGRPSPRFLRCEGQGEIWIGPPARTRPVLTLRLEDEALFVREARVLAFSGTLGWDAGRLPAEPAGSNGSTPARGAALLHLHGRGQVLVDWAPENVIALRVSPAAPAQVPETRLLGWLGQAVLRVDADAVKIPGLSRLITCEGEGVLLIARDGQAQQSIHQRTEPGDHGSGGVDSADPLLHR